MPAELTNKLVSDAITEIMAEMGTLSIPRFGTFGAVKEDERIDIDISTGKRVLLPPAIVTVFSPASVLKKKNSRK